MNIVGKDSCPLYHMSLYLVKHTYIWKLALFCRGQAKGLTFLFSWGSRGHFKNKADWLTDWLSYLWPDRALGNLRASTFLNYTRFVYRRILILKDGETFDQGVVMLLWWWLARAKRQRRGIPSPRMSSIKRLNRTGQWGYPPGSMGILVKWETPS